MALGDRARRRFDPRLPLGVDRQPAPDSAAEPEPQPTTFRCDPEWNEFAHYGAPNSGAPSCDNPGSRNADVLTARINSGLVITAPTTFKQLDAERSFPFSVANQSNTNKFYEIKTTVGKGFSKLNPTDRTDTTSLTTPRDGLPLLEHLTDPDRPAPQDRARRRGAL